MLLKRQWNNKSESYPSHLTSEPNSLAGQLCSSLHKLTPHSSQNGQRGTGSIHLSLSPFSLFFHSSHIPNPRLFDIPSFSSPSVSFSLTLSHTHTLAVSFPSLCIHIYSYTHIPWVSPSLLLSLFFALSNFQSHTCSCLRGSGLQMKLNLSSSAVSLLSFLQTSLKIRAQKAGVFSPPLLPPSLSQSPRPWWSSRGNRRVTAPARRFLWLVLFSGWFGAWKRHRKAEREQRRLRPGFRFPLSCASNHSLLKSCALPVLVLYWDFLLVLESRNPTSHYFTTEAFIKKYI